MSSEHQRKQVEEQVLLLYPAMYRLAFAYVKTGTTPWMWCRRAPARPSPGRTP